MGSKRFLRGNYLIETVEVNASFIPLTHDNIAVVDTEDYNYLNQWKWHADKGGNSLYACRNQNLGKINGKFKYKKFRMHRLILDPPKKLFVDHINGNGLDNRRSNLRLCNMRQNCQNQKNRKRKKSSKYPGVYWDKSNNKWVAGIRLKGKRTFLGYFEDEHEAAKKYEKVLREQVGEELICKS